MATFAESLRNEVANQFKNEFLECIGEDKIKERLASVLRNYGEWDLICDDHINSKLQSWDAVPLRFKEDLLNWLHELGLKTRDCRNYYGVRCIKVML